MNKSEQVWSGFPCGGKGVAGKGAETSPCGRNRRVLEPGLGVPFGDPSYWEPISPVNRKTNTTESTSSHNFVGGRKTLY